MLSILKFFNYKLYPTLYSFPDTFHVNLDHALHYENKKLTFPNEVSSRGNGIKISLQPTAAYQK